MSVEKSFNITLKLIMSDNGSFESVRLLKSRSQLSDDILDRLNRALKESLIPAKPVRTTIAIGDDAEIMIMNHLLSISSMNTDFEVADTSSKTGHGDICVRYKNTSVCVEVKNYSNVVPMPQIEKYHKSLALPEYDAGIMIQVGQCGYARESGIKTPIDFRIVDGKPSAYLTATNHDILYPLIKMLIANCGMAECIDSNELEKARNALIAIHEKITDLRGCIDSQKKSIARMEGVISDIAKLSC